ncbi:ammonium transporter [Roseibium sp.]|uniref:ammonium transporter n=1 Tax=Roseibium sp. TaxID=1936156 RepID=UPI003A974E62
MELRTWFGVGTGVATTIATAGMTPAWGQDIAGGHAMLQSYLDLSWVMISAALVLLMQVGFMLLEAGLVRSKNSINVAQKNLLDFAFSVMLFAAVGFMVAFGRGNGFPIGIDERFFVLQSLEPWEYAFFGFQVMFCGTAATIISGAVAERMRLSVYIWCSIGTAALIYPIFTHWAWGSALYPNDSAYLANKGFVDFAGSTVVHGTGGWIALAAVLMIGPRIGKFNAKGKPARIQGHSSVLATTGGLLLFVGWIGFNGGSTLSVTPDIAHIIANTVLAAAAGGVGGYLYCLAVDRVILPERTLSGLLGGLVAVTAGCHILTPAGAFAIGIIGGVVALVATNLLERYLKVDDPVGAVGVHAFAGIVGTAGLALLAPNDRLPLGNTLDQLLVQLEGIGLNFIWCFCSAILLLRVIKIFMPLRVRPAEEEMGMNEAEHGTRLGIGHVEDALDKVIAGRADLNLRLQVTPGDDSERVTRLFNALMETIQSEEIALHKAEDAKRSREEAERLSALANATFDAIVISVDGRILDGNAALEDLLGHSIEDLKMRGLYEFVQSDLAGTLESHLIKAEREPREMDLVNRDGESIPVEIRTRVISYRGTPTRVSALVDLRARKEAQAQILHLAQHDPLTDLPNRAVFNAELNQALERCQQNGETSALLLLDLDRFKDINDLHGHPIGDKVIRTTADRLRSHSRPKDLIARLGGDEFAIIQRNIEFANQAADMAHRFLQILSDPIDCGDGLILRPHASIGVAILDRKHDMVGETLVANADIALYEAKSNGRATYCMFQEGMGDAVRQRRLLEEDLHDAISEQQFELYYQPRLDLASGSITSYEALIRWNHPERGIISPAEFIPVAESSGQIIPIGKWVLHTALNDAREHLPDARISVNVSPVQFRDNDFADEVRRSIEDSGVPAKRLELEITENLLIEDDARALSILTSLKQTGVKIALDDFGVGYSSLGYLSRFPFDTIKIDRSFIKDRGYNTNTHAIIDTVVRLGKALNMTIVAEGVEDMANLLFLKASGCDELQGYFIGKPKPIATTVRRVAPDIALALAGHTPGSDGNASPLQALKAAQKDSV